MSLHLYVNLEDVPQEKEIIEDNRKFFTEVTIDKLDKRVDNLLKHTDEASFIDNRMFKDKFGYNVAWRGLSSGGMTALNVFYNEDKVFSLCECGRNALIDVRLLTRGNALFGPLMTLSSISDDCDILVHDSEESKLFTSFKSLVEEGY
jgi:hypothetical protein